MIMFFNKQCNYLQAYRQLLLKLDHLLKLQRKEKLVYTPYIKCFISMNYSFNT